MEGLNVKKVYTVLMSRSLTKSKLEIEVEADNHKEALETVEKLDMKGWEAVKIWKISQGLEK